MQLSRYLANAGICSRRKAEDLIKKGLVEINGVCVTECSRRVAETDEVRCQGVVAKPEEKLYIALNKPSGVVTTACDEHGRQTVLDLISHRKKVRLYPIGRLDCTTTGILLLTNDGDLAQQLAHPRYEVEKRYHVTLTRPLTRQDFETLKAGVTLSDGFVKPDGLYPVMRKPSECTIVLHSGKNRVVRRFFHHAGFTVKRLERVSFAGITTRGLARGQWRELSAAEIERVKLGRFVQPLTSRRPQHEPRRAPRTYSAQDRTDRPDRMSTSDRRSF